MFKKIFFSIIICISIFQNFSYVIADNENEEVTYQDYIEVTNQTTDEPIINSRIAVAYDRKSGNVIWGKDENKRSAMASTTKIMTSILLIENCDLNQTITVSRKGCFNWWFKIRFKKR